MKKKNKQEDKAIQTSITKEEFIAVAKKCSGMIRTIAKVLGITRWQAMKLAKEFGVTDVIDDFREELVDIAENKLLESIQKGDITAIIYTLKTLGRYRGYSEKIEMVQNSPFQIEVKIFESKQEKNKKSL